MRQGLGPNPYYPSSGAEDEHAHVNRDAAYIGTMDGSRFTSIIGAVIVIDARPDIDRRERRERDGGGGLSECGDQSDRCETRFHSSSSHSARDGPDGEYARIADA